MYLNKAHELQEEELPWDTLRYLIGEAMYGGRVTDNLDRRVLNCYLEEYLGEFIFDTNQKFLFATTSSAEYTIPEEETFDLTLDFIDNIPLFTPPGVFGLHSNAEITYYSNSAKRLWGDIMSMQTSEGGGSGGIVKEDIILQVAEDIQSKTLPELFDEYNIRKSFDVPSPTQVVLLQELERFNILIKKMGHSIKELKRALNGEIGMSQDLDVLGNSFFNGQLPPLWAKVAPQTEKNLVNWIGHFERRFQQYRDWVDIEEPKVIWLSGLHIPESYTTALIQTTCRMKGWALDKSTMYSNVTKMTDPKEVTKRLEQGTYIQGLYLEGARWNMEEDCLDVQRPKELVTEMPLIQIIPVEANKLKLRGTIKTPVYITQARKNAMGVGMVFEADIKSKRHESHWVLQGVAMVLNTD
jgi:dynein heavy chain, axonemal